MIASARRARPRPARWLLATLCFAIGVTAIAGGGALVASPDGALVHTSTTVLSHSPFATFLVPGLLLLLVVGVGNAIAGWLVLCDAFRANAWAFAGGAALFVWITTEMALLRTINLLQVQYFVASVAVMAEALRRRARDRAAAPSHTVAASL
jgi:hypothetical protein